MRSVNYDNKPKLALSFGDLTVGSPVPVPKRSIVSRRVSGLLYSLHFIGHKARAESLAHLFFVSKYNDFVVGVQELLLLPPEWMDGGGVLPRPQRRM